MTKRNVAVPSPAAPSMPLGNIRGPANGQRLAGIHQRSVMSTSRRYAKGELQRIVVTRYDNS